MHAVHTDTISLKQPDYRYDNPLNKLLFVAENQSFSLEREHYDTSTIQHLFTIKHLEMHPAQTHSHQSGLEQDDKLDMQKQNVRDFLLGDMNVTRGIGQVGGWRGPFVRLCYRGGPDSVLSQACAHHLGDHIKLWCRIGQQQTAELLRVPYNSESDCYQIELWGYPYDDLDRQLDPKGFNSLGNGELLARPDLIKGNGNDFNRENIDSNNVYDVSPEHTLHPIRALNLELAWCDHSEQHWDSKYGANHHLSFSMLHRGWEKFLRIGSSDSPHGGIGSLHYRNLFSNYFFQDSPAGHELGQSLHSWNQNAHGERASEGDYERFFAVQYMDMHVLEAHSAIGIHRHRDNQEAFMLLQGEGLMIIGDWLKQEHRERCFEIRTLTPGYLALLKGGQLHSFANLKDEPAHLFVFGGYD